MTTGATSAPGDAGEILVRGPNVFAGYFRERRGDARGVHGGRLVSHRRPRAAQDDEGAVHLARPVEGADQALRLHACIRSTSKPRSPRIRRSRCARSSGRPHGADEAIVAFVQLRSAARTTRDARGVPRRATGRAQASRRRSGSSTRCRLRRTARSTAPRCVASRSRRRCDDARPTAARSPASSRCGPSGRRSRA